MDWIIKPSSGEEVTNIDWIIEVLPGTKNIYGRQDLDIKSWAKAVKTLRDLFKKICNLRG